LKRKHNLCLSAENQYRSQAEFFKDLELIWNNAKLYNGDASLFDQRGAKLMSDAREFLEPFGDQLSSLEANIEKSKYSMYEEFGDSQTLMDLGETGSGPPSQAPSQEEESDDDDADMELVEQPAVS
jgi:hypothetical protein